MTDQQDCPDLESPIIDLRPLTFQLKENNKSVAVFEALIDDSDAPGAPMYTLTVTAASSGKDDKATEELYGAFLSDMLAGFVLTAPSPDEDPCDDQEPDPFDLSCQLQIEADLVQLRTLQGAFDVVMLVHTAVGQDFAQTEHVARSSIGTAIPMRGVVMPGKDHRYKARHGLKTATVTAREGSGTIRRPVKTITVGGGSKSLRARTVIVHGETRCVYDFVGRFKSA